MGVEKNSIERNGMECSTGECPAYRVLDIKSSSICCRFTNETYLICEENTPFPIHLQSSSHVESSSSTTPTYDVRCVAHKWLFVTCGGPLHEAFCPLYALTTSFWRPLLAKAYFGFGLLFFICIAANIIAIGAQCIYWMNILNEKVVI
ncbi:hypothetical protein AVEN_133736-1 [Araneus ventricosus]|uniref:Uncharacterized protein n=1 Tax=Araneus ventricosus TaxID=182803 RepID=A0A4Y2B7U7_ARAVE|nr:hypothetical protein AVEN_133736-1 [Araneus ventricosus]